MEVGVTFLDIKLGKQCKMKSPKLYNKVLRSFSSLSFHLLSPVVLWRETMQATEDLPFLCLGNEELAEERAPVIWNLWENVYLFLTFSLIFMLWLCMPRPENWNHNSERNHLLSRKIGKGLLRDRAECNHRRESWIGESLIRCSSPFSMFNINQNEQSSPEHRIHPHT